MKQHLEGSEGFFVGLLLSMRPWQWYKQSLVLLPLLFSGNLLDTQSQLSAAVTLVAFCTVAGSVYVFNDISDVEADRKHPQKRHRPIASGQVGVPAAAGFGLSALTVGLLLASTVNVLVVTIIGVYLGQNVLYNLGVKDILFADVLSISIGFVLRALAGVYAISPFTGFPSPWLIVCTLLTALILAIGKRRQELIEVSDGETRSSLDGYSVEVLDQVLLISTTSLLISYTMYTFFGGSQAMMLTLPFALFAIFRYHHIIYEGGNVTQVEFLLFDDTPFLVNLLLWVGSIVTVIYVIPRFM